MIKLYILKGKSEAYALVKKIAAEKFNNAEILKGKKHLHFIGIGGSGMFPLVQILHTMEQSLE